jgi:hypothetical protein
MDARRNGLVLVAVILLAAIAVVLRWEGLPKDEDSAGSGASPVERVQKEFFEPLVSSEKAPEREADPRGANLFVSDLQNGAPVPNAKVVFFHPPQWACKNLGDFESWLEAGEGVRGIAQAYTDIHGERRLLQEDACFSTEQPAFVAVISAEGYVDGYCRFENPPSGQVYMAQLERFADYPLELRGVVLEGFVVDHLGAPVTEFYVNWASGVDPNPRHTGMLTPIEASREPKSQFEPEGRVKVTSAKGVFRLEVEAPFFPADESRESYFSLTFRSAGLEQESVRLSLPRSESKRTGIEVLMEPGSQSFEGLLYDSVSGEPVSGATVMLCEESPDGQVGRFLDMAKSEEQGSFGLYPRLTSNSNGVILVVADGYSLRTERVAIRRDEPGVIQLGLEPLTSRAVRLVYASTPLAERFVVAARRESGIIPSVIGALNSGWVYTTVSDQVAVAQINSELVGPEVRVYASIQGGDPMQPESWPKNPRSIDLTGGRFIPNCSLTYFGDVQLNSEAIDPLELDVNLTCQVDLEISGASRRVDSIALMKGEACVAAAAVPSHGTVRLFSPVTGNVQLLAQMRDRSVILLRNVELPSDWGSLDLGKIPVE